MGVYPVDAGMLSVLKQASTTWVAPKVGRFDAAAEAAHSKYRVVKGVSPNLR